MIIAVIIADMKSNLLDTFNSGESKHIFLFDIICSVKSKIVFYAIVMIVVKICIKIYFTICCILHIDGNLCDINNKLI